jgi:spore coat protein U-like protein
MTRPLIVFAAAFPIALASAGALAQNPRSSEHRIDLYGEAPSACVIRTPGAASGTNASFAAVGASSGEVRITELVDPNNAEPRAASINLALPVICNAPHRVTLRSGNGGLLRAGGQRGSRPGGFGEFLPYQLSAQWAGSQVQASSDRGAPLTIQSQAGRAGDVSISVAIPQGGQPLVAGTYADAVTIEFEVAN